MLYRQTIFLLLFLASATTAWGASILTNCNDIAKLLPVDQSTHVRVRGKILDCHPSYPIADPGEKSVLHILTDDSGGTFVMTPTNTTFNVGEMLDIEGTVVFVDYIGRNVVKPTTTKVLGSETPEAPIPASLHSIRNGDLNFRFVSVEGLVIDAFPDELDPRYFWVLIYGDDVPIPLAIDTGARHDARSSDIIGCKISATGICLPSTGRRRFLSSMIRVQKPTDLQIVDRDTGDAFGFPQLNPIAPVRSMQRNCIDGRVLAVWENRKAFILPQSGKAVEIQLHPNANLPSVGMHIRASGFAESNIFYASLLQAIWKPLKDIDIPMPKALNANLRQILTDSDGKRRIESEFHGRLIRLRGTLAGGPSVMTERSQLLLSSDGHLIPLDISSFSRDTPFPLPGTSLAVTGVCRMEFGNQHQIAEFARIRGFQLIVRSEDDIEILATPSWWTPVRLIVVIGILAILLIAILLWNLTLRIIAERRGRELFRENVAHISADLRTEERTRLAVDLHDSLAQMLTGVSLQIDAGEYEIASKSLKSCRDELRNCLWDLRNQTLEERDMGAAIRRTLKPHINSTELLVRFNVPRQKLSDLTAHSVLMIIRELATNAVRHGHAKTIRVAGGLDADELRFSVRDDGCGFDPDRCLGMAEGHFGLQGIRERVKRCDGTVSIENIPGKGTRVTISLKRQK